MPKKKPVNGEYRIKMNNYIEHKVTFSDRFENIFVKAALLLRGSRKLFSNETEADKYIEKAKSENYVFSPGQNFSCRVSKKRLFETEYAVFEPNENEKEQAKTTVLYLHGGAYVRHMTKLHLKLVDRLCKKSHARFIVPAYLTAPKHGFSESASQIAAIYEKETKESEKAIIAGDSCGGAIGVCILPLLSKKPDMLLLFSPLLKHEIIGHEETEKLSLKDPMFGGTKGLFKFINCWEKETVLSDPMKNDFSFLPKTYVFTSKGDMLSVGCFDFFEKAKESGADITLEIWDKMFHDFVLYPLPCSKALLNRAAELIGK